MTMIAGVFSDANQVQPALEELLAQHFDLDRMSVLVSEHHHRDEATVEHRDPSRICMRPSSTRGPCG